MAFQSITYAISYDILLSGICIYLAYLLTFFLAFYLVYFLCGWWTLWSGAHGWGPAGNTLIWSLRWRACSWGPAEEGGGGGGPADIKSNNPHLDLQVGKNETAQVGDGAKWCKNGTNFQEATETQVFFLRNDILFPNGTNTCSFGNLIFLSTRIL